MHESQAQTAGAAGSAILRASPLHSAKTPWVEVAGIEPASSDDEPGLLRAQLAQRSLGSCTRTSTLQTSPVSVNVPVKPSDESQQVSPLDEARVRDGGTPGLTLRSLLRQRERSQCAFVRHLLFYKERLRDNPVSSARFPCRD